MVKLFLYGDGRVPTLHTVYGPSCELTSLEKLCLLQVPTLSILWTYIYLFAFTLLEVPYLLLRYMYLTLPTAVRSFVTFSAASLVRVMVREYCVVPLP